jgi:DNA-binding HxlR family transcriptional regulator/putative sterol carrier protein
MEASTPKRSYNQFCPFARTLDIIGERWTLLVIRNFIAGPQRYKDLLQNLPGIGTNLLAARLKELEREGIIHRRKLPPPAGSTVYEFTELGRGLEEPLLALARWGMWTLSRPDSGAFLPPAMLIASLKILFRPEAAAGVHETYEYHIDAELFHARIDDGTIQLAQGPAPRPDLVITSDSDTWKALASRSLSPQKAMMSGKLKLEGDPAALVHVAQIFAPLEAARSPA